MESNLKSHDGKILNNPYCLLSKKFWGCCDEKDPMHGQTSLFCNCATATTTSKKWSKWQSSRPRARAINELHPHPTK